MSASVVHLQRRDATPLAVIRQEARATEIPRLVPEFCGLVWNAVRAQQVKAGRHVAIYWDSRIRLEAGVEVFGNIEERERLVRSATPAGLVASIVHFGPYAGLGVSHRAIADWCDAHGHRAAGPSWEIYGHWVAAWDRDPSQIETEICYLIAEP